jgi:hypothetical protein
MSKTTSVQILFLLCLFAGTSWAASDDPLLTDVQAWKSFLKANTATDETSKYIKDTAEPLLVKAEDAIAKDRRYFALHILGAIRGNLFALKYVSGLPEKTRKDISALEQEYKKVGIELAPVLNGQEKLQLDGLSDAARAIAEAAFSEVKVYYDASLEYAQATDADAGAFYLGLAQGQRDLAHFCEKLKDKQHPALTTNNQITDEIDEFETYLLSLYKPPATIDQHPVFIRTSAMIKQAHELIAANMNEAAFYRYLDARRRLAPVSAPGKSMTLQESEKHAAEFQARLAKRQEDHSLADLFIEMGLTEAGDTSPNSGGETANVIFSDVLPHYFKALEPAVKKPSQPKPEVTVTLVRWPYT